MGVLYESFDDKVNADTIGSGGYELVEPGFYQMEVVEFKETDSADFEIDFKVVLGTREGQVGKKHKEFIKTNDKDMNRRRRTAFAWASELVTKEAIDKAKETGEQIGIDYSASVGAHVIVEIVQEERQKKDDKGEWVGTGQMNSKVTFDHFWHLNSDEVKKRGIPTDASKIDREPFSNPPGSHQPEYEGDF